MTSLAWQPFSAIGAEGTSYTVTRPYQSSPLTTGLNLNYYRVAMRNVEAGRTLSGPSLTLEVEWHPFSDLWGKPAIGTTFGYQNIALQDQARQVLHLMPVGLFASYRFDYLHRQWLVPYVKAGGLATFYQSSGGGRVQNVTQWTYGAGVAVSLGAVDTYSARHMDSGLGINDFQLTVEYMKTEAMDRGQRPDLAHDEFRFGIRFEI